MSHIDWHREMLADRRRVRSFGLAVQRAVRPGDVVADIGTGTGLLALVAAAAGAARVYAIDRGPIIEVARQAAVDNGLAGRLTFVRGEARQVELPEPVDLVTGEIIGAFGVEEDICEVFAHCRERFLKPGGRMLPDALDLYAAPCTAGEELSTWPAAVERDLGLDLKAMDALARHAPAAIGCRREDLLAPGARVLRLDLAAPGSPPLQGRATFAARRPGRLCGLVGWFRAWCDGFPVHATEPPSRGSSWAHAFLPIGAPVDVAAGQIVAVEVGFDDPFLRWEIRVEGHGARAFHQFRSVPAEELRPPEEKAHAARPASG